MIPKAILMRSGLVSLTTVRPVNTAQPRSTVNSARPMTNVFNKAHSTLRRCINNKTGTKNSNFNHRVNTVSGKNVNTARPKEVVNTAKPKAVGNPQIDLQDQGVIDSGCSRHMTGNMSYLTDFKEIDGGYIAFGGKARMEIVPGKDYILLPLKEGGDSSNDQEKEDDNVNNTNNVNTASDGNNTNNVNAVSSTVYAVGIEVNAVGAKTSIKLPNDLNMPELEDIVYSDDDEDVGAEADMNNLNTFMPVSPIPTTRIHKDHPVEQIIRDLNSAPQTRRMTKNLEEHEEPKKMDVKSAFLYGKIEEEVYVCQPPGFEDPDFPNRVYKVEKVLYELHQAPRAWDKGDILLVQVYVDDTIFGSTMKSLCTEFEKMMHKNQDKYVTEILKKFGFTDVKTASTPMETQKPLLKDEDGEEVDIHLYRSIIGSLMYLTSSRPDIMFAVCACARYQVNLKVSHLHVVKIIFRYLKGQPKLGLWYPKDSPFDLVAYTDSDYAGASLDMKSTTRGCQFLGCRLISWQCKKQTMVANSTTEAEYVAASSCCSQVLWIQNQLLDYGDFNEKKLIQMIKIHTDKNIADLLIKAFDNGIGVNAGDSKLMLLGINLLPLGKVNAARHNLLLLVVS
ncbi:putative ribonuclease H-like domain-containing protein [Tanacetum coccineum]|uniref:Ribonuclease H-like domain-containing protein n=1 Tax=Tanacetum coccineum TaxID=301880 RepID=A0ABQ5HKU0_9ASTR